MRGGGWKTEVGGRRGWRWAQHGSDQYYLHTKFPREWNEDGEGQDAAGRQDFSGRIGLRFIYSRGSSLRLDGFKRYLQVRYSSNRESLASKQQLFENPSRFKRSFEIERKIERYHIRFKYLMSSRNPFFNFVWNDSFRSQVSAIYLFKVLKKVYFEKGIKQLFSIIDNNSFLDESLYYLLSLGK